jgi:uncharacterized protein YbjT (DUF2867 family)
VKVILFGGTGNLGGYIAREVIRNGYSLTVVVRKTSRLTGLSSTDQKVVTCSFVDTPAMTDIMKGQDVVISALGKSISPSDRSKASFEEVDLRINRLILKHALQSNVHKFVYISAFHAEKYPALEYCRVHEQFAAELTSSGLDYSIIKPPSLFSAYLEMIPMAKKGLLFNFGKGDKKTNPIFDGDLAQIIVQSLQQPMAIIEAGGRDIYSRAQLSEIIQQGVAPHRKVRTLPLGVVKLLLPIIRLLDKNAYDKMAFFTAVMEADTLAPPLGETNFAGYIRDRVRSQNPTPADAGSHSFDPGSQ